MEKRFLDKQLFDFLLFGCKIIRMRKVHVSFGLTDEQLRKFAYLPPYMRSHIVGKLVGHFLDSLSQETLNEILMLSLAPKSSREKVKKEVSQVLERYFNSRV
jgi:hypothetical protein